MTVHGATLVKQLQSLIEGGYLSFIFAGKIFTADPTSFVMNPFNTTTTASLTTATQLSSGAGASATTTEAAVGASIGFVVLVLLVVLVVLLVRHRRASSREAHHQFFTADPKSPVFLSTPTARTAPSKTHTTTTKAETITSISSFVSGGEAAIKRSQAPVRDADFWVCSSQI